MLKNLLAKKLKIGGIIYTIKFKELDGKCGLLDRDKDIIYIDNTLSAGQQQITLWHEIIHAINSELSEEVVDSLAFALQQILKDNK